MEEIIMDVKKVQIVRKVRDTGDKDTDYYEATLILDEKSALKINRIKESVTTEASGGTRCRFDGVDVKFNINKQNLRRP